MIEPDNFLVTGATDEFIRGVKLERKLLDLSLRAQAIANCSGLTRREIAKRMGHVSPSTVQRIVREGIAYNATVESLVRFADACDHELLLEFVPLATSWISVPAAATEATGTTTSPTAITPAITAATGPSENDWLLERTDTRGGERKDGCRALAA